MTERRAPPALILSLLFAAIFLTMSVYLMLAPLLVELAAEFHTSVAIAGQLVAATSVTWAVTAPLVGPLSDTYGRRLVILTGLMLMALGVLGSVLSWSYGSLLGFRLLTGIGMANIPPNSLATIADVFSPERRGKALGWLLSATGVGTALGIPGVALLADAGGWQLPFYVIGALLLILWGLLWVWLPRSQLQKGEAIGFLARFRQVGAIRPFWYVLGANLLMVTAFSGVFTYLAAYLIQTYSMHEGEVALPLTLAGLGVIIGSLVGGRVAGFNRRLLLVSVSFMFGGLVAALVFATRVSPWLTVALASGVAAFLLMSWPVTSILLIELAGRSRATALGMFAVSNQAGTIAGTSLGGLMLAFGGFPMVGIFCLVSAVAAAAVMGLKVRESSASLILETAA
jgi:DHA1 family inner membrane transport protein